MLAQADQCFQAYKILFLSAAFKCKRYIRDQFAEHFKAFKVNFKPFRALKVECKEIFSQFYQGEIKIGNFLGCSLMRNFQ